MTTITQGSRGDTVPMAPADIIEPRYYREHGYPHEAWTRLRREAPVAAARRRASLRSGRSRSTPTSSSIASSPSNS